MTDPHPHTAAARSAKLDQAEALGIDRAFIDRLVEQFYAKIRADAVLGPIFAGRITDWPPHLARMKGFWAAVLRGEGGFSGNPMAAHSAIPGIESFHFRRWLILFEATLQELEIDPSAARLVSDRAHTIADSLLTGIRIHRDGRRDLQALKGLSQA